MAIKNNLYKQSLVRSANSHVNLLDQAGERHWSREWFNPPKPKSAVENGASKGSNGFANSPSDSNSATPQPVSIYPFQLKTWVLKADEESVAVVDCEDNDYFELSNYDRTGTVKQSTSDAGASESGLSAAEIKGAVGGAGIPGFSSSAAQEMKEKEKQQEGATTEPTTVATTTTTSTSDSPAPNGAQESPADESASTSATPAPLEIVAEPSETVTPNTDADGDVSMS